MKAAIIQFNPKTADIAENADRITTYITNEKEADVIIFPALSVTGINCRDYFLNADFIERQNAVLEEIKELSVNSRDIIIGFAEKTKDGLYSSVALYSNGEEKILCRKKNLL